MTDLEIAKRADLRPLSAAAAQMGLDEALLEPYGRYCAKISLDAVDALKDRPKAKYIVVTAVTPTPLGEGKTTTTVGLGQAFGHIGSSAVITIRQPSMGPTFGIKGGAAGGGFSQVVPMERMNLHLTGDMHAVTAANNQLAAMIDNHIFQGNKLGINPHSITWRRVVDINDRALRNIVTGLGSKADGIPRQTGFDITPASEVMAVLALSTSLQDMRRRLGRIVIGESFSGEPVTAEMLRAAGAMTVMLKDAVQPNLLQTLENTPAIVHTGPFGNIAHGNSSVIADLIGIRTADFLVTEAGFGADMGAERFFNIKCRCSGLKPDAAVIVATVRALKAHSGRFRIVPGRPLPAELLAENTDDVLAGAENLKKQIENVRLHGVSPVVALNAFPGDFESEHKAIINAAVQMGARAAVSRHFAEGGRGAAELAETVREAADEAGLGDHGGGGRGGRGDSSSGSGFTPLYPEDASLKEKIETVACRIYGADGVDYDAEAARSLRRYEEQGFGRLPVCIAKTHLSLSSNPRLKGAPKGWRLPVNQARVSAGAGFVYVICGGMRTMPGLSSSPSAEHIDIDENGEVIGLS